VHAGVPTTDQRLNILKALLGRMQSALEEKQIEHVANFTHGFVGADLVALSNEAALVCLRRCVNTNQSKDDPYSNCNVCNGSETITKSSDYAIGRKDLLPEDDTVSSSSTSTELTSSANSVSFSTSELLKVTFEDFERARMKIRPSAMREVY